MPKPKSALSGIMITAGSAVGAGMFSLPVASSGMWFTLSILCLLFLWLLNYLAACYILEANVQFEPGASFDTIATKILGNTWKAIIGLSVAFLMYILLYAYYSAFGNITTETLGWDLLKSSQWAQGGTALVLGAILAFIVWLSTAAVGRICTILIIGMVITFFISMSGFALHVEAAKLFDIGGDKSSYFKYLWAALPYFMTSFGFATVVPSLYKYYGRNTTPIHRSFLYGSLIAFLVYALFLFVAFGNISREGFVAVNEAGGNIGHLVNAFGQGKDTSTISSVLTLFSNFAIISSFLGVGLGLFDYIADLFSLSDDASGRFKTACIAFLPSGLLSFFFPNGFLLAIGFAGLVVIIGFFIAPFFMIRKTRSSMPEPIFKVIGGNGLLWFFLLGSVLVGVCQILGMMGYLPKW